MDTNAVKIWTKAGVGRFSELEKPLLSVNYWQNGRENKFL